MKIIEAPKEDRPDIIRHEIPLGITTVVWEEKIPEDRRKRRLRQKRRCWNRHNKVYNAARRVKGNSIEGKYAEAKRNALKRGQEWQFTANTWKQKWLDAGWIVPPGTDQRVTAFYKRGPDKDVDTFMVRRDASGPWSLANCDIFYRGEILNGDNSK